jgi:hypothetical protein
MKEMIELTKAQETRLVMALVDCEDVTVEDVVQLIYNRQAELAQEEPE